MFCFYRPNKCHKATGMDTFWFQPPTCTACTLFQLWHTSSANRTVTLLEQLLFGLDDAINVSLVGLQKDMTDRFVKAQDVNQKKIQIKCTEVQRRMEVSTVPFSIWSVVRHRIGIILSVTFVLFLMPLKAWLNQLLEDRRTLSSFLYMHHPWLNLYKLCLSELAGELWYHLLLYFVFICGSMTEPCVVLPCSVWCLYGTERKTIYLWCTRMADVTPIVADNQ